MQQAVRLIEVDGLPNIGWDASIVLVQLLNAIHLDGEQHGDAEFVQPLGEGDGLRCSPTVAVYDDAGAALFGGAQAAIFVLVQKTEHGFEGGVAVAVGKDGSVQPERIALLEIPRHRGFPVNEIVRPDIATHKADDNQFPEGLGGIDCCRGAEHGPHWSGGFL
ncbi:MAG: hypothetical protein QOK38_3851 [Acidobacteriaceae bacterium]|nr:hypothetical protein [Acidobacteriaceae bacterium]